jgi:hypothetical protein
MGDGNTQYKVHIVDASLFVRRVALTPSVAIAHTKALERGTAKYPINKVDCKVYSIPAGNLSIIEEDIFNGRTPNRVIVTFVESSAYHGDYKKNPFNFKHMNLDSISIDIGGQHVPHKPLTPRYSDNDDDGYDGNYIRAYHSLFAGTDMMISADQGNAIKRSDYSRGYTIYCFDLTPDLCTGGHLNPIRAGNIRVSAHFSKPLHTTTTMIVYGEFQNIIEIDRSRNIIFDYAL